MIFVPLKKLVFLKKSPPENPQPQMDDLIAPTQDVENTSDAPAAAAAAKGGKKGRKTPAAAAAAAEEAPAKGKKRGKAAVDEAHAELEAAAAEKEKEKNPKGAGRRKQAAPKKTTAAASEEEEAAAAPAPAPAKKKSKKDQPPPEEEGGDEPEESPADPAGGEQKERKKRRNKPGRVALREIKRFQGTVDLIIPKRPFRRVAIQAVENMGLEAKRWEGAALNVLQEAAEAYLVSTFEASQKAAIHGKRITCMPKDLRFTLDIRGDREHFKNSLSGGTAPATSQGSRRRPAATD